MNPPYSSQFKHGFYNALKFSDHGEMLKADAHTCVMSPPGAMYRLRAT
jgi:hypothetical protein